MKLVRSDHPLAIARQCKLLDIHRSGFYYVFIHPIQNVIAKRAAEHVRRSHLKQSSANISSKGRFNMLYVSCLQQHIIKLDCNACMLRLRFAFSSQRRWLKGLRGGECLLYYCPKENFEDTMFINLIREIHDKFPYYGYRKIHWYLVNNESIKINRKRVQKLMKLGNIKAIYPKPKTSAPSDDGTVFPYLLKGLKINRPNQVWAIDITYIKLPTGMVYLFAIIDWHSRFIVAYKLTNTMEACHGVEVLNIASLLAIPEICNADQGSQFTGKDWIDKLREYGIKISHDGVGRCIDNIRIERFWRTMKYEDVFIQSYDGLPEARDGIKTFIEHYNYSRPHQALGYKTPATVYFESE